VIANFKSKALSDFWETGKARGFNPNYTGKVRLVLDALEEAEAVEALDVPGFGLHPLKGDRKGQWAIMVSRNWRVTFRFEEGNACDVEYEDYH
jgi:proteic killer suppression protein